MDTLLEQMDHAKGPGGLPVAITGLRALIQRLLIRLCVRKGSFSPDPQLGSELYLLAQTPPPERDRMALHWAAQALLPEGAAVKAATCRADGDSLAVSVTVEANGERFPLEVIAC